jgi:hypothetical protein
MSNLTIPICDFDGAYYCDYVMEEGKIYIPTLNPLLDPTWNLGRGFMLEVEAENHLAFIDMISSAILSVQELTKSYWNQDCSRIFIEYGSKPLELSVPLESYHIVKDGRLAAMDAALSACDMFPEILEQQPMEDFMLEPVPMVSLYEKRKWHKSEILVYFNAVSHKYIIHFNRLNGDRVSFSYTWGCILRNILQKTQMETPEEYVNFMENHKDFEH